MPAKKGQKYTKHKFDEELQEKFCDCIARGLGIAQASACCDISRSTYLHHYNNNAEFRQAFEDAEEAACDVIENALFEAAKAGDVKAQQVWLFNKRKDKWADSKNIKLNADIKSDGPMKLKWAEDSNVEENAATREEE